MHTPPDVAVAKGARIRAQRWAGTTGGIIAFLATGEVTLEGDITADGAGFRGGEGRLNAFLTGCDGLDRAIPEPGYASKGEGIAAGAAAGAPNVANAGGGGACHNAGGGGGGHGGRGGKGGRSCKSCDDDRITPQGLGGAAILYDTSNVIHHYPEDRYVGAALQLFASVALLFWYVLQIFLARGRD